MKTHTKYITLSGIFIALATVLSTIKIYKPPMGGSVTLFSMLPIVMLSCIEGVGWGLGSAFVYSAVQLAIGIAANGILGWGLTPAALMGTVFLDYIIPYTLLGFSGAFAKKGTVYIMFGTAVTVTLRFLCHFLSGAIIFDIWCEWKNVWLYSLIYNGSYMLPELIITIIGAAVLFRLPQIKRLYRF